MRFDLVNALNRRNLAVICLSVALTGCASFGPKTPEEQVKARAQQRSDALVKGDHDRVYGYFTPGYRGAVSAERYRSSLGSATQLLGATVHSVQCETLEKCIARVKLEMKPLAVQSFTGTITTYADETWLFEAGQWWLFQKL